MEITAMIVKENADGIRTQHRVREESNGLRHGYKAITIKDGKPIDLVDLRIAVTQGGTPYACIWLYRPCRKGTDGKILTEGMWSAGSGTAGGYGYHKVSAAADTAIRNAGVKLSQSIHGLGDAAVKAAVQAIGEALEPAAPVYVVEMNA